MKTVDQIVSIIGDSYLEPIADLTERLISRGSSQNDVKVSAVENGYAVSLCILLVAWFESWVTRVRYLNSANAHAAIKQPVEFLYSLYPDLPIYDELVEVFVLRDTLAHNHLWLIKFSWDDVSNMHLRKAQKDAFYGDKKYRKYVDLHKRRTKKLGLNIVPIKVGAADFKVALKFIWKGLEFIRTKDPTHLGIGNGHIKFQSKLIPVRSFVTQVCNSNPS